mgnify:CR=1 FL=1|tara:strand:- start:1186 stop:1533 length:348 start_codon:yes stop_codon:yes gene_type:complete
MINDWLNQDPDDGFDPNDHGIEMDEIAKLHAMADMNGDQEIWAREQANKFYNDFEGLDIEDSVLAVNSLIKTKALDIMQVNTMLDNMIRVFLLDEEFEKCHVCNEIKKGLNNAGI